MNIIRYLQNVFRILKDKIFSKPPLSSICLLKTENRRTQKSVKRLMKSK